ncbi:M23 family metallopeptidase [Methylobacterium oryzae]|uniref:M23 family metallopeptidase n=1 Tax=Methylobacterium oryzae TaxID=334852 RepID=UPI001F2DB821|nr:M23 family metallopeptidase [Methylobacterium oryzae]UIN38450.1 M23 family metallopeptidase [Methylobacterium oryzae]
MRQSTERLIAKILAAASLTCFACVPTASATCIERLKDCGQTGKDIDNGARKLNEEATKAARKGSDEIANVGRGIGHAAKELEKAFCSIMTNGGSERGTAACEVNAGIGYEGNSKNGHYYTYDPSRPEEHHPVTSGDRNVPTEDELRKMERNFKTPEMQEWERLEAKRSDSFFIKPGSKLGLPWKDAVAAYHDPTPTGQIRKGGEFLDKRKDKDYPGGYRLHGGIDFLDKIGDPIFAITNGTVVGIAHVSGLEGLIIKTSDGYTVQEFYFTPSESIRANLQRSGSVKVSAGEQIGTADDLHKLVKRNGKMEPAYPPYVEQHVHVTVKDPKGLFVSPDGKMVLFMRKGDNVIKTPVGH